MHSECSVSIYGAGTASWLRWRLSEQSTGSDIPQTLDDRRSACVSTVASWQTHCRPSWALVCTGPPQKCSLQWWFEWGIQWGQQSAHSTITSLLYSSQLRQDTTVTSRYAVVSRHYLQCCPLVACVDDCITAESDCNFTLCCCVNRMCDIHHSLSLQLYKNGSEIR